VTHVTGINRLAERPPATNSTWVERRRWPLDCFANIGRVFSKEMADVTQVFDAIKAGKPQATDELLPLVYQELRKLAAARLAREKPGQTLDATSLVHEAYIRLVAPEYMPQWDHRGHFFAAAAEAMRRILVERARRKKRLRHGGERKRVPLDEDELAMPMPDVDLLALDEALSRLAQESPRAARLVELRFFAGLGNAETADALVISAGTAKRDWRYARAWLHREMNKAE
jgi:RNA polymerase sigma factor (TIGR02999 family)